MILILEVLPGDDDGGDDDGDDGCVDNIDEIFFFTSPSPLDTIVGFFELVESDFSVLIFG